MNKQQNAAKCFNSIMELHGVDDFKETVKRLKTFQQNKEKISIVDVAIPNYLWISKRGGGISTCLNLFADFLYNAQLIEFTGIIKYFEYKIAYITPDSFFSELTRLNNTISEIAGHHRYFRGIACINIDDWINHTNETYFFKFLDYIAAKNNKVLFILYVHSNNKNEVESIESSLSSRIRFETVALRFPDSNELIEYIDKKYFTPRGFSITNDAKALLTETIESILNGKHFNGFVTVKQLANDILYKLLTTTQYRYEITADLLSGFTKNSAYIKRLKTFVSAGSTIGFGAQFEERVI